MMRALIATVAVMSFVGFCRADDVSTGKQLANINCARCHALGEIGDSPFKAAPPFRIIHENYSEGELEDSFNEGVAVAHPAMPDWNMTSDEARQLAAFVMSFGEQKKDVSKGRALAVANCSRCHAIDDASENSFAAAPPFRDVVKRYDPEALAEALAEGIATGHPAMPEFEFSVEQVGSLLAYFKDLEASARAQEQ